MQHPLINRCRYHQLLISLLLVLFFVNTTHAQTTAFTYQGKLTDAGNPANAAYNMQFKLFDALVNGNQIGATLTFDGTGGNPPSVSVTNGIFTANLDFGASVFTGMARYLEISVRPAGSPNPYTVLAPRQLLTSSPYAIRTISATSADALSNACVACVQDAQINSIAGSKVNGLIPVASVPAGSANYVQNTISQQALSNFNISGNGLVGGNVGIGVTNPANKLVINTGGSGGLIQFGSPNSESGMTITGANRADIRFDGTTLKLLAGLNSSAPCCGIAIDTFGNVGIGTFTPAQRLTVQTATSDYGFTHTDGNIIVGSFVGGGTGGGWYGTKSAHPLSFFTNDSSAQMTLNTAGNVGIGTTAPAHRLSLIGGPAWTSAGWTGAVELGNGSAIGWRANAAGSRFGIGQTNGGLYFFGTGSDPGTTGSPVIYDMVIHDNGDITQPSSSHGLVKAMIHVNADATIDRCYNGATGATTGGCGFTVSLSTGNRYVCRFDFPTAGRFASVTPEKSGNSGAGANIEYHAFGPTDITVSIFVTTDPQSLANASFTIIVY